MHRYIAFQTQKRKSTLKPLLVPYKIAKHESVAKCSSESGEFSDLELETELRNTDRFGCVVNKLCKGFEASTSKRRDSVSNSENSRSSDKSEHQAPSCKVLKKPKKVESISESESDDFLADIENGFNTKFDASDDYNGQTVMVRLLKVCPI